MSSSTSYMGIHNEMKCLLRPHRFKWRLHLTRSSNILLPSLHLSHEVGSPQASPQSEPPGPGMEPGASCVGEPSFQPRRWFWAGCFECSAQEQSSGASFGASSASSLADSGCGSQGDDWGPEWPGEAPFEKASFGWGCFWIRGACLWNSWEYSGGEPFPSKREGCPFKNRDQGPEGGSGPPLEGSGGGRDWAFSPSRQRATATAFPFLWDPRECGRHVGFRVGGRQYSWASFAGFGKPFWIDWWSDGTSWDSSPFRGTEGETAWNQWLDKARVGKGLATG